MNKIKDFVKSMRIEDCGIISKNSKFKSFNFAVFFNYFNLPSGLNELAITKTKTEIKTF